MAVLPSSLRKRLESAIRKAREVGEAGAKQALESLAVHLHDAHASMTKEQCELRKHLRAHGRQLGDERDREKNTQEVRRLAREVAYEHWHRMLFARFLAENGLLIEPAHGVAVTLEECGELARAVGEDTWQLAARFAEQMLPKLFRPDDPALSVALPPESRQALERLLGEVPPEVFTSEDALGWTYQFWQAAEKERVNAEAKSGKKITGETLPAVTQLFTEHYMVLFLLQNTLGAWHAGKVLAARPGLAESAASEAELRRAVALPGYEWEYLRFVREPREGDAEGKGTGPWRPAAGTFPTWPKRAAELTVLDPCCGSGHFLVAALEILVRLRQTEEGLALEPAIRAVLAENLHGLELDPRCTQIAAFNLALAAWRWAGKPIELPPLQIACSGLAPQASKAEWLRLAEVSAAAGGMPAKRDLFGKEESLLSDALRAGLEALHELFARAPELGSLIDPSALPAHLFHAKLDELEPLLARAIAAEDEDVRERAVTAAGMARAAGILAGPSGGYALVATNVPYLGRKSHSDKLKAWVDANHKEAKNDLATVFVSRMLRWVGRTGTVAAVTPQNWLFLTGYRKLREELLNERAWDVVVRMGEHAFESTAAAGAFAAMVVISGREPEESHLMSGIDVSAPRGQRPIYADEKAALLRGESAPAHEPESTPEPRAESVPDPTLATEPAHDIEASDAEDSAEPDSPSTPADGLVRLILQSEQLKNPDARISFFRRDRIALLSELADSFVGLQNNDSPKNLALFWEVPPEPTRWVLFQLTTDRVNHFSGRSGTLRWPPEPEYLIKGTEAWGKLAVMVRHLGSLPVSLYHGQRYDQSSAAIVPADPDHLAAIWAFCTSPDFALEVRRIDQALKVTNASLVKVPFDLAHWRRIATERYPEGLPEPQSNDPTQWLFHGHPAGMLAAGPGSRSAHGVVDPVGADRHASLICREPSARDVLQVSVARLLGYRWPAEHDESMRLDIAARAWVEKCRELHRLADEDGIVCLPSVRGEPTAAERLRRLLVAAFADVPGGFTAACERELLAAAAGDSTPTESLDEWLREQFFEQHCALFHSRPFLWHVWDGRKDGFGALVNYHRLAAPDGGGRRTLESLAFTYLGEWIDRQKAEQAEGREGADGRLEAALKLQAELRKILDGAPPYDLFVRWKPLHEQALGWEPDINDGVRLNIRPFLKAADLGRKGAGILRARPKSLKWDKDRGKEPESLRPRVTFPWFWGYDPEASPEKRLDFGAPLAKCPAAGKSFDGQRWNDLHYTRAAKEAARQSARSEAAP